MKIMIAKMIIIRVVITVIKQRKYKYTRKRFSPLIHKYVRQLLVKMDEKKEKKGEEVTNICLLQSVLGGLSLIKNATDI